MADELNVPTHRWYEPRNNIALPPNAVSAKYILANGVALIDAWINSRPWGPYSVDGFVPPLALDFVADYYQTDSTATTFDSALTFTRASSATMVDSTGTLITVPSGTPRLGHHVYNGSAWVNEGLLVESEARTNLVTYSQAFTSWASSNSPTVTANAATSPDGSTNATALLANGTGGFQQVTLLQTLSDSTDYCFSIYFKAAVGNSGIRLALTGKDGITRYFGALSDGTLSTPTGATNVIVNTFGNNWYRLSGVINSYSGATAPTVRIYPTDSTGGVNTLVSGDGIYLYGAQLEAGSTPSSYIPTAGATVTRAAETLVIPSANLPWSSTAVSIAMDGRMTYADTGSSAELIFFDWEADKDNQISAYMRTDSTRTGQIIHFQEKSSVIAGVSSAINTYSPGVNVPFNIASRHGSTFINGAADGVALTADLTPIALPDLSATNLQLGYDFMGTIGSFRIWADDIGDAGIAEASA